MPKLAPRWNQVALPFVLTLLMTFVVSGISTVRIIGLASGLLSAWMLNWLVSWLVAFPVMVIMMPLARRIVAALVEPPR
jgi:hypothetical protein